MFGSLDCDCNGGDDGEGVDAVDDALEDDVEVDFLKGSFKDRMRVIFEVKDEGILCECVV